MSLASAEGRVLQFLIRGFGIRRIIEIGALFGYSSLCMAKALPSDGEIISLEKDPGRCAVAVTNARANAVAEKIDIRCGDALDLLAYINGPVDMVFADTDKAGYVKYLNWAEKNVRRGGLIVGDNTFLFGALWGDMRGGHGIEPWMIPIMDEFNRRLANPALYNSIPDCRGNDNRAEAMKVTKTLDNTTVVRPRLSERPGPRIDTSKLRICGRGGWSWRGRSLSLSLRRNTGN